MFLIKNINFSKIFKREGCNLPVDSIVVSVCFVVPCELVLPWLFLLIYPWMQWIKPGYPHQVENDFIPENGVRNVSLNLNNLQMKNIIF